MSYETYSLVKDLISARRLEPISMKGISLPVVPYAVDVKRGNEAVIETETEGLSLRLDLNAVDGERAERLRRQLLDAVAALTTRIEGPRPAE
jgi:hypothetical protein